MLANICQLLPLFFFPLFLHLFVLIFPQNWHKHSKHSYVDINTKHILRIGKRGLLCQLRACADHIESQLLYQNNSRVQTATGEPMTTHIFKLIALFWWHPADSCCSVLTKMKAWGTVVYFRGFHMISETRMSLKSLVKFFRSPEQGEWLFLRTKFGLHILVKNPPWSPVSVS